MAAPRVDGAAHGAKTVSVTVLVVQDAVDLANRMVAAKPERRWNVALDVLAAAEHVFATLDATVSSTARAIDAGGLRALAADLPSAWHHPVVR